PNGTPRGFDLFLRGGLPTWRCARAPGLRWRWGPVDLLVPPVVAITWLLAPWALEVVARPALMALGMLERRRGTPAVASGERGCCRRREKWAAFALRAVRCFPADRVETGTLFPSRDVRMSRGLAE